MTMFFEMANVDVEALKACIDANPDDCEWSSNLHSRDGARRCRSSPS